MKFMLIDSDGNAYDISMDDVHTIFEDAYAIYVVFKDKSFLSFPNTLTNRNNLPPIKLGCKKSPN